MEDLAIQIKDLKKSYKELHALKGVNINIPKGDLKKRNATIRHDNGL